jgi:hypothetical protein
VLFIGASAHFTRITRRKVTAPRFTGHSFTTVHCSARANLVQPAFVAHLSSLTGAA